ncbi:MAG: hypothetical protein QOF65_1056 [Thermoleophilaceae bacterium]|nr:hypothetical protein [Thermoleophilaceae bacterium]
MVVALVALFVAMGGLGYAATNLPKNSVGSKQIKANAVTSAKVKNGALTVKDVKSGQFARPGDLAHYLPLGATATDSSALGGVSATNYELGDGNVVSGEFSGTSPSGPLLTLPHGATIGLNCNSSGLATFFHRRGGDSHTYDIFTTTFKNGVAPSLSYLHLAPADQILSGADKADRQTVYDITADDGPYGHVIVSGHFNSATNECTVAGHGVTSRQRLGP